MAGYIDSLKGSLRTLTGLQLPGSDPSRVPSQPQRPLGLQIGGAVSCQASTPKWKPAESQIIQIVQATSSGTLPLSQTPKPAERSLETNIMATAAVTPEAGEVLPANTPVPVAPVKQKAPFIRFIDRIGKIGGFLLHEAPVIAKVAQELEPEMALTPFGPEYKLVVDAIVGAQRTASMTAQVGAQLTGDQKMALVISAITPALAKLLESKGVKSGVPDAIAQFAQSVYGLQAGPVALIEATIEAAEASKPTA